MIIEFQSTSENRQRYDDCIFCGGDMVS